MTESLDLNIGNISFVTLIASFTTSGMISLGKIPNPMTNKIEADLEHAKYAIDMLVMLQEKTKGNLSADEDKVLKNAIGDLQVNFLHEKSKV